MRPVSFCTRLVVVGMSLVALAVPASSARAQTPDSVVPVISARQYTSGSVTVVMKGSLQLNQQVAINTAASISDGEMTWLQFGASGSALPNVLVTYGDGIGDGVGITAGQGKVSATAGSELCDGEVTVTATSITGHYTCPGVTSYDSGAFKMGKVDIEITFTAQT